ncbi:MAG: HAMP domain-containing sensor histidine kinase [Candidatus Gracilibacteria bacterium]|nr:HAMP domain-containing sensor histidine kinase [Candidatus Gracilibacteria bacterium]
MHINSIQHLEKQKKKLSLIFTVIIFIIIIFLDIFFLTFKYIDSNNKEIQRLNDMIRTVSKDSPFLKNMLFSGGENIGGKENIPPFRGLSDAPRRMKSQNIIVYKTQTKEIIFSPLEDIDFIKEILNGKNDDGKNEIINLGGYEYYLTTEKLQDDISVLLFSESRFTKTEVLKDFLEYFLIMTIFSILLYFVIYKFVDKTLTPVEENMKDMEQFIYNAGHELKTPLSVAKSSLQLAKIKKNPKENIDESIEELDKMNSLIETLINLASADGNIEYNDININEEIKKISKNYDLKIIEKDLKLKITENTTLELKTNEEYFKILFSNILSNAIRYNREGGEIEIIIDKGFLTIKDTGIGIKKESLGKVFDRFFQDNEARNQEGFGIGLSLVKKIADINSWKIQIESEKDKGTTIKIIF